MVSNFVLRTDCSCFFQISNATAVSYTHLDVYKRQAMMFNKSFKDDLCVGADKKDIVLVRDIPIFSYCEHHIALMYDMSVSVAYIPKDKVLGLSKIARICDMASKRLQLQDVYKRQCLYR